jgi:hypothetical protein
MLIISQKIDVMNFADVLGAIDLFLKELRTACFGRLAVDFRR